MTAPRVFMCMLLDAEDLSTSEASRDPPFQRDDRSPALAIPSNVIQIEGRPFHSE
jgi:hypothetical protein